LISESYAALTRPAQELLAEAAHEVGMDVDFDQGCVDGFSDSEQRLGNHAADSSEGDDEEWEDEPGCEEATCDGGAVDQSRIDAVRM
jgi:hypothetical protein